ncbi:contact-dependent growth inhibition system immunity protein [Kitasatospora sp. NPDC094015]|uniref:contact-dependent growth inhibition system immunity protein n=1 Tax=Kitasatospora sp. NPDC094015 TaxID=3155205 RepID=UPI0033298FA3
MAIEVLRADPAAEGDLYAGDLLAAVLTTGPDSWIEWPALRHQLRSIVSELDDLPAPVRAAVDRFLAAAGPGPECRSGRG